MICLQERCVIVDGHSLMYRAFHALPPMDADGVPTNAVHGFFSMLLRVLREQRPQYCVVAFDDHAPTFRHDSYDEYKAGRAPTPDELRPQFPLVKELLAAMGIGVLTLPGWEADDLLGTVARQANEKGIHALLLTGDKDALQLVNDETSMLFTRRGISETVLFTPAGVKEYFGVTPEQVPDWKGMMGDSSDNIPGIPGVGEKTAVKLLDEYGTLENVLTHAADIKGKLGERVRDNVDKARFSKQLATIDREAPITAAFGDWMLTRLRGGLPGLKQYQLNVIAAELTRLTADQPEAQQEQADAPKVEMREVQDAAQLAAFAKGVPEGELVLCLSEEAMSLAGPDDKAIRLPLGAAQQDMFSAIQGATMEDCLRAVAPALQQTGLITHDAKRLLHRMRGHGLPLPTLIDDTMILAYLHNPQERSYALGNFATVDAPGVAGLRKTQLQQLAQEGMEPLYREIELPLVRVLFDMEQEGFQVDREPLIEMGQRFTEQTRQLQEEIYQLTGVKGFNINSPQQLGKVLFEDLGLPSRRKTRTGWSTDADTLEVLREMHPAVDKILAYRQIVKLNGTYIDGLLRKVDASGRIHTTFDQVGTATGRISSNEPNLQNIPVRSDLGKRVRSAFVSEPGRLLLSADYSQVELRVLAHVSGDQALLDSFAKGEDVHTRTAAEVFGVVPEAVTGEMRRAAKAINFGIAYGQSAFGLGQRLDLPGAEAQAIINRYFERYRGVRAWLDATVAEAKRTGEVSTLFGRKRYVAEIHSRNFAARQGAERIAVNTPIQGTAADLIKRAMIEVDRRLAAEKLRARLLLQVHDELLVEAPEAEVEAAKRLVGEAMAGAAGLKVPLVVEVGVGRSWAEAH
ncbi:MAG TPA: DNA polymerase I [Myxococcales bacterium]|nr:DNA polymerase I [Myxococcales bacterium]